MDGKFSNNPSLNEVEDPENSPENSCDSPRSGMFGDGKTTSTSSPKRSKRGVQKKVVSVPVREGDSAPPSDKWAWRKYGQKPIKGSPYPRGYYRCSSSKGCPARKQVERSRVDPTTVVVTYSCDHNHSWPVTKNNHRNHHNNDQQTAGAITSTTTIATTDVVLNSDDEKTTVFENQLELDPHYRFSNLGEESMINTCEFKWFLDFESTSSTTTMLDSPILDCSGGDAAVIFSMREEDESLFGDLGELPECAVVFRRGVLEREEERQRCNLARWCGTKG